MPGNTRVATRGRQALRGALGVAEALLLLAGVLCLGLYALACAQSAQTQAREAEAFERALRARLEHEAPDTREWSPGRVERFASLRDRPVRALARLEIPRAGVSVMVLDGTDEHTLDRAVGVVEGTARPGESGNVGIAGHRDGWFRGLRHLEPGDPMSLTHFEGVAHYEVESIQVVAPSQVEVLAPTAEPKLTLVTCYPFYFVGDAPDRYIVTARQVAFEPWEPSNRTLASQTVPTLPRAIRESEPATTLPR